MSRLWAWVRWEFDRPIEVTGMIRFITIERFVKAAILIAGGLVLLVISNTGNGLHQLAENLQTELNLSPGRGAVHDLYARVVVRFGSLSQAKESAVAVGAMLYGALEGAEGIGLLRRRRWAEYLVLVATVVFIPYEIDELIRHPTLFKAGAFAVNVLIVVYLIWRKRLFLERPGRPPVADVPTGRPG